MASLPHITVDAADDAEPSRLAGASASSAPLALSTTSSIISEGNLLDDPDVSDASRKSDRFKHFLQFSTPKQTHYPTPDETNHYNLLRAYLVLFHREKDLVWDAVLERCFFGDIIDHLFSPRFRYVDDPEGTHSILRKKGDNIMCHLLQACHNSEYSKLQFEVPAVPVPCMSIATLVLWLKHLAQDIAALDEVLDLYAKNANTTSDRLLLVLANLARSAAVPMPLAHAMLGSWRVSYEHGAPHTGPMADFRTALRQALLYRNLVAIGYFDDVLTESHFAPNHLILLKRFFGKDTNAALGLAIQAIGQYHHQHRDCDLATDLWEIGAHATGDTDCCELAIWGLSDGFGSGNLKGVSKLSSSYKKAKFVCKRRIAHLYRILLRSGKTLEIGILWVRKLKYD